MRISDWSSDVCSSDLTGWSQGPNAVLMGIVGVAFFGNLDEAGKAIAAFGRFSILGLLLAGFISYGLLPFAQDFPSFALLIGLVMLPLGAWAATNPKIGRASCRERVCQYV